ncbi:MAG: galactokinase [Atopobiaceae bacterium]
MEESKQEGIMRAHEVFEEAFGKPEAGRQLLLVHAPGRSEIAGNHTDHEGGHVIAGALDVAIDAVAVPRDSNEIRLASDGYPLVTVGLEDLSVHADEKNTTASLVRGMAAFMAEDGRTPSGFDIALTSTIPVGGGLSSSAAIEAALGRAMEALWEGRSYDALSLARMSQKVENVYFGKPCGLMDQASVCLGGLAFIDFKDSGNPKAEKLVYDFEDAGYSLILVKVGAGHEDLTDAYAAIPQEMQEVAHAFGGSRLADVDEQKFLESVPALREKLGDRPVLRALHYWNEDRLVQLRWEALQEGKIEEFLAYTAESGKSSAMYLQNVTTGAAEQPAMVALALAERILEGKGACRIHGGGFGGTIQCFVPAEEADRFQRQMDAWLGDGASRRYHIADRGAYASWK